MSFTTPTNLDVEYNLFQGSGASPIQVSGGSSVVANNVIQVAPTVSISAPSVLSTTTGPVTYTLTYSGADAVTLAVGDVTLNATGTATGTIGVSGSGLTTRTVTVSAISGNGTLGISVAAGTASNASGIASAAGPSATFNVDNTAPGVTINQAAGQGDPTATSPISFTVVFSEPVTGFTGSDIAFTGSTAGGTLVAGVNGSGANYTVTVMGMTTPGTVVASIPAGAAIDALSLASAASTSTDNTVTWDATAPTVTINQSAAQADPTGASPISFSVVFSEPVTGFTGSDVSFAGSSAGGTLAASVSGSGATYTVTVNGMTTAGTIIASIPGGAAADVAGNSSTASTSTDNSVTFTGTSVTFAGLLDPWGPPGAGTYNGLTFTSGKVFKMNSVLPIKWGYAVAGTLIDSSASQPVVNIGPLSNCAVVDGTGIDTTVSYSGPGSTSTTYDPTTKTWQLNLKLNGAFSGDSCYLIQISDPTTGLTSTVFPFKTKK